MKRDFRTFKVSFRDESECNVNNDLRIVLDGSEYILVSKWVLCDCQYLNVQLFTSALVTGKKGGRNVYWANIGSLCRCSFKRGLLSSGSPGLIPWTRAGQLVLPLLRGMGKKGCLVFPQHMVESARGGILATTLQQWYQEKKAVFFSPFVAGIALYLWWYSSTFRLLFLLFVFFLWVID